MGTYFSPLQNGFVLVFVVGASAFVIDNRIIGGFQTSLEEYPYQLQLEGAPNGRHVCGASVIASHWALTAAHCVYDKPLRSLRIRSGSTVRGEGGTHHPVNFHLYHDLYRADTLDYDLALVNVKKPFMFGPKVMPVVLPRTPPQANEAAMVSGWGFLEKEQLRKPKNLVAAEVFLRPWDECKKIYPSLTPRMMCAGAEDVDFCHGDSGGPLTRFNREQLGIVSWLYKCGDGMPGVYTNVSAMMPWIMKSLQDYGVYMDMARPTAPPSSTTEQPDYVLMFPSK